MFRGIYEVIFGTSKTDELTEPQNNNSPGSEQATSPTQHQQIDHDAQDCIVPNAKAETALGAVKADPATHTQASVSTHSVCPSSFPEANVKEEKTQESVSGLMSKNVTRSLSPPKSERKESAPVSKNVTRSLSPPKMERKEVTPAPKSDTCSTSTSKLKKKESAPASKSALRSLSPPKTVRKEEKDLSAVKVKPQIESKTETKISSKAQTKSSEITAVSSTTGISVGPNEGGIVKRDVVTLPNLPRVKPTSATNSCLAVADAIGVENNTPVIQGSKSTPVIDTVTDDDFVLIKTMDASPALAKKKKELAEITPSDVAKKSISGLKPLQPINPLQPLQPLQPLKPLKPLEPLRTLDKTASSSSSAALQKEMTAVSKKEKNAAKKSSGTTAEIHEDKKTVSHAAASTQTPNSTPTAIDKKVPIVASSTNQGTKSSMKSTEILPTREDLTRENLHESVSDFGFSEDEDINARRFTEATKGTKEKPEGKKAKDAENVKNTKAGESEEQKLELSSLSELSDDVPLRLNVLAPQHQLLKLSKKETKKGKAVEAVIVEDKVSENYETVSKSRDLEDSLKDTENKHVVSSEAVDSKSLTMEEKTSKSSKSSTKKSEKADAKSIVENVSSKTESKKTTTIKPEPTKAVVTKSKKKKGKH